MHKETKFCEIDRLTVTYEKKLKNYDNNENWDGSCCYSLLIPAEKDLFYNCLFWPAIYQNNFSLFVDQDVYNIICK